jgi:hypothetical protein
MGSQITQFRLYQYSFTEECVHELLVRVNRPAYPNYSQTSDDAAEDFADSAADHLRKWWQRWLLPRDCRREHESRLLDVMYETISDELDGPGLQQLTVWVTVVDDDPVLGIAATEEEFWRELEDYDPEVASQKPRPQAVAHNVYFLTEQSGELDLRDA